MVNKFIKIKDDKILRITREGKVFTNLFGKYTEVINFEDKNFLLRMGRIYRKRTYCKSEKDIIFDREYKNFIDSCSFAAIQDNNEIIDNSEELNNKIKLETLEQNIQKFIDFFSEFEFEPNFRFLNTFNLCKDKENAKNYILNYFELTNNINYNAISDKLNSIEFNVLYDNINKIKSNKKINNRLSIYYGSQGTGKTTEGMKECDNNVMVCHSAMLPSDLMEDFEFVEGKAKFKPSALQIAMKEGKKILLDEINLLPFESLRFLQSILDDKKQIIYKGEIIKIKDGFKIIGTMNLQVNGSIFSLPEPLVDRADSLKKYKLNAKQLLGAII